MSTDAPDQSSDQPRDLDAVDAPAPRRGAHPVLVYTVLRTLVLIVTGGLLYLVGVRGVWLLLFAFLISGIASIFVLDRRREAAAGGVVEAVQKVNNKIETSASAEDALVADAGSAAARDAIPADDDLADLEPDDRPLDDRDR